MVKVFVLVGFTAFLVGCCYSTTFLNQEFRVSDFLAEDSYARGFVTTQEMYVEASLRIPLYFRFVDQSDPEVQAQMRNFIDDISALPQSGRAPEACWVRDFHQVQDGTNEESPIYQHIFNSNMTFEEQLDEALSIPAMNEVYGRDIARDAEGRIVASRCYITATNLDLTNIRSQVELLARLKSLSSQLEINQGRDEEDFAFFVFEDIFFLWEFYTVAKEELITTIISGVVAISVIGFVLIPHWTSIFLLTPLIMILYVDLLGKL
jgi:hypothetical protein